MAASWQRKDNITQHKHFFQQTEFALCFTAFNMVQFLRHHCFPGTHALGSWVSVLKIGHLCSCLLSLMNFSVDREEQNKQGAAIYPDNVTDISLKRKPNFKAFTSAVTQHWWKTISVYWFTLFFIPFPANMCGASNSYQRGYIYFWNNGYTSE